MRGYVRIFPSPKPAATQSHPDFRHVKHWVFDLDNTLYRADSGVFARIDARMTEFIATFLNTGRDEARALQKSLYREHGTTLNGMMKIYGMDPEPYLDFVHQIDLQRPDATMAPWPSPSRVCRAAATSSPMAAPGMPHESWRGWD